MKQLLMAILVLSALSVTAVSAEKDLADYKAIYEKESVKIEEAYQKSVNVALSGYARNLDRVEDHYKKAGDLNASLALKKEQVRLDAERSVPAESPAALPELARKARAAYHQSVSSAEAGRAKLLTLLSGNYLKRLDGMKKTLVFQDKLDEAVAVDAEMKRVEFIVADIAASLPKPEPRPVPTEKKPEPVVASEGKLPSRFSEGLNLHLLFSGTLENQAGSAQDPKPSGEMRFVTDRHGAKKSALELEEGARLEMGKPEVMAGKSYSWTGWFKLRKSREAQVMYERGGEGRGYQILVSEEGLLQFVHRYGEGDDVDVLTSEQKVNDGDWHFLAAVVDHQKGEISLHVDGGVPVRGESDMPHSGGRDTSQIGRQSGGAVWKPGSFDGTVDDIRIYLRALSDSDVELLYAHEKT